jgi:F0F1-type ATP synthase assembly protein I
MTAPASGRRAGGWYGRPATKRSGEVQGRPLDDAAWSIFSSLLAGIALYGGLGWVLSLWLGNRPLLVAGGVLLGLFLALYLVHKRLGNETDPLPTQKDRS